MDEQTIKILLIEDNPGDTVIIREMLKEIIGMNFKLINATGLNDGFEIISKEQINIILLDLNLSDSFGIDTFYKMNKKAPNIPIIILTGLSDEELAINAVGKGAQDYLVKGQIESQLLAKSIKYAIERKNIERKLRESEEKYRLMVEKMQSGIFLMNSQNKLTYINLSFAKMLGYKISDMVKKDLSYFIDANGIRLFNEYLKKSGHTYELKLKRKDGSSIYALVSSNPLYKADGSYLGAISILTDISSRKNVEQSLMNAMKEKNEDFFLIMGNMMEAIKPLIQNEYKDEFMDKFA